MYFTTPQCSFTVVFSHHYSDVVLDIMLSMQSMVCNCAVHRNSFYYNLSYFAQYKVVLIRGIIYWTYPHCICASHSVPKSLSTTYMVVHYLNREFSVVNFVFRKIRNSMLYHWRNHCLL